MRTFEATARKQLGFIIRTLQSNEQFCHEQLDNNEMSQETALNILRLQRDWAEDLKFRLEEYVKELPGGKEDA